MYISVLQLQGATSSFCFRLVLCQIHLVNWSHHTGVLLIVVVWLWPGWYLYASCNVSILQIQVVCSLDRLSSACFSLGLGLVWVLFAFLGDWSRCACFRFELNVMVFFLILFNLSSFLVCWIPVERRHCFGTYVPTASVGIYFLTKYREIPFSPWLRPLGPSFEGYRSINHYSILFQQLREPARSTHEAPEQ